MINPWAIVGALALLLSVAFGGAVAGRKIERSTWQEKEIKTAAAANKTLADAIANAQRIQQTQDATARKVISTYENELISVNKKYSVAVKRGGLRVPATICPSNPLPATGASPIESDDAGAATVELPNGITENLFSEARRADELAEQLRGLQNWIKSAGYYGESP